MLILDGPMGTELGRRGVATPAPGWSAYALESSPESVRDIHRAYAVAGAQAHRGNTFRTQPKLFPERYVELALRAHALLRQGLASAGVPDPDAGGSSFGCMAPIEDCYRPDLSPPESVARGAHRKMASALRDAGYARIVCETFPHAAEARIAVEEAVATGLETWLALTAGPDGALMSPEAMERAARDGVAAGARAVLVCCTSAAMTGAYVERLARIGVPFGAYANAGDPAAGLGWAAEPMRAAAAYATLAAEWVAAGASIVGACCGAGPAHIAELATRFG